MRFTTNAIVLLDFQLSCVSVTFGQQIDARMLDRMLSKDSRFHEGVIYEREDCYPEAELYGKFITDAGKMVGLRYIRTSGEMGYNREALAFDSMERMVNGC